MASIAYIASMCQSSVNTQSQNGTTKFQIRVLPKHYWKQDYKAAATQRICEVEGEVVVSESLHNYGSNISTLEKKTLKIYLIQEDLNYGISRTYAEFWKKIRKKVLVGCQKNLVHQKVPYITRLRHLENHIEAVDLYLMNWHLSSSM